MNTLKINSKAINNLMNFEDKVTLKPIRDDAVHKQGTITIRDDDFHKQGLPIPHMDNYKKDDNKKPPKKPDATPIDSKDFRVKK
jgi:hypothetical protein